MIEKFSPNFNDRKNVSKPSLIILHYTGMDTAKAAFDRLIDPASEVSAHYTVGEDGETYHHVDEEKRAWHAGHSFWRDEDDINSHSIGIEIVNPGHEWGYRPFTGHQMKSVTSLCLEIMKRHGIEAGDVLAHSDIAPARKQDPGEYFPWHELAKHGVGEWPDPSDEDTIKAAGMNVERALHDYGYDPRVKLRDKLMAFQRHFVPEAFVNGHAGEVDTLTRVRLYALLAGHFVDVDKSL